MRIGDLPLENNIFLAPMAGITNLPFRSLLRDFGCGLAFTEMISATGLARKSSKSFQYLRSSPLDKPLSVQLFGSDPLILAEGAKIVAGEGAELIDINMGCPARKVVRTGAGSSLLKNPTQVGNIVKTVRKAISIPFTIKIRSGWSQQNLNAVEVASIAEDNGVDGVIVHPRTTDQGFSGRSDWDIIKKVKEVLRIPVIGNGDVRNGGDAIRMLNYTGCDGVMVGRGVLGNPWVIDDIISCLSGCDSSVPPSLIEREQTIARHLEMEVSYYGEQSGVRNFHKHLLWYTKGLPESAKFRKLAINIRDKNSLLNGLRCFFQACTEYPIDYPDTGNGVS